ncbi:MAG: winged helix-turn-helix domain-containing protein [Pseudomonadota bacterium]
MENITSKADREALKALRQQRQASVDRARDAVKTQAGLIKAITGAMKDGAGTIPEIAAKAGVSTSDTLVYVATLKKYGRIGEGPKEGDYFRYELLTADADA